MFGFAIQWWLVMCQCCFTQAWFIGEVDLDWVCDECADVCTFGDDQQVL